MERRMAKRESRKLRKQAADDQVEAVQWEVFWITRGHRPPPGVASPLDDFSETFHAKTSDHFIAFFKEFLSWEERIASLLESNAYERLGTLYAERGMTAYSAWYLEMNRRASEDIFMLQCMRTIYHEQRALELAWFTDPKNSK